MDFDTLSVNVVIPAAGSGERFNNSQLPKQFVEICGKPLICYAVEGFLRIHWIKRIIVVTASNYLTLMQKLLQQYDLENKVDLAIGGSTRHRSIYSGIKALQISNSSQNDIVIIHDGARPIVDEEIVEKVVANAFEYGASGPICKLTSTVLKVDNDLFMNQALDRTVHYASEMPQAFRFQLINEAYEKCSEYDFEYNTECLDLVQRYSSSQIKLVEGNPDKLWKVTHPKDLFIATNLLKAYLAKANGET